MKLSALLQEDACIDNDIEVTGLALDSRKVLPGYAFIAVAGSRQHGLMHASQALDNGAVAVIYEPHGATPELLAELANKIVLVAVAGLGSKLGMFGARFFNDPSKRLSELPVRTARLRVAIF